jgi:putative molybdopterin biosynthesis protein
MAEYMTTKEVAAYLRINEKKVYALVAEGQLPASRISGKWLFPKHIIDQWVEQNTRYPAVGLMGALLDDVLIIQGSDDWLFSRIAGRYQAAGNVPVVSATVGSLAGLAAVTSGKAHLAGCHVDNAEIEKVGGSGLYLVNLFTREQGLLFDGAGTPGLAGFADLARRNLRFAERQPLSGTHRLSLRLAEQEGIDYETLSRVGPYTSHLDLALAIRNGEADAGMGTKLAATQAGLDFATLHTEPFKLVIPTAFASQSQVVRFLEFILAELRSAAAKGLPGYAFDDLGRMETIGGVAD